MIRCRPVTPFVLVLMLTACSEGGSSVSGSASETAGSSSGLSSLWERVKSLGIETGKTYEMPALGIMADAFMSDTNSRHVAPDAIPQLVMHRREGGIPRFDQAIDGLIEPTRKDVAAVPPAELAQITLLDAAHMIYAGANRRRHATAQRLGGRCDEAATDTCGTRYAILPPQPRTVDLRRGCTRPLHGDAGYLGDLHQHRVRDDRRRRWAPPAWPIRMLHASRF